MTETDTDASHNQWLARKEAIVSRFQASTTTPIVDRALGVSLIASGVATIIAHLLWGEPRARRLWAPLLGGLLVFGGFTVLGGGAYGRRSERISVAEQEIHERLAELDPLARAQILKDMAGEAVGPLMSRLGRDTR